LEKVQHMFYKLNESQHFILISFLLEVGMHDAFEDIPWVQVQK